MAEPMRFFIWIGGVLFLMAVVSYILKIRDFDYRHKNYPEHEIKAVWDDDKGELEYTYYQYGLAISSGGEMWAKDMAKHYNIKITYEDDNAKQIQRP